MSRKMTLTAEFDAEVPDDRRDLALMTGSRNMYLAILAVDEHLRTRLKYGDISASVSTELQTVRDLLRTELRDLGDTVFG